MGREKEEKFVKAQSIIGKLPTFGAARLKREFDLPLSHMAIQRIWRRDGLIRERRRK